MHGCEMARAPGAGPGKGERVERGFRRIELPHDHLEELVPGNTRDIWTDREIGNKSLIDAEKAEGVPHHLERVRQPLVVEMDFDLLGVKRLEIPLELDRVETHLFVMPDMLPVGMDSCVFGLEGLGKIRERLATIT